MGTKAIEVIMTSTHAISNIDNSYYKLTPCEKLLYSYLYIVHEERLNRKINNADKGIRDSWRSIFKALGMPLFKANTDMYSRLYKMGLIKNNGAVPNTNNNSYKLPVSPFDITDFEFINEDKIELSIETTIKNASKNARKGVFFKKK